MIQEVDQLEAAMMSGGVPRIEAQTADERVFVLEQALKVMVDNFCRGNVAFEAKYRAETYAHNSSKNTIAELRRKLAELDETGKNWLAMAGANRSLFARVKELEAELAEANRKIKSKNKAKRRK